MFLDNDESQITLKHFFFFKKALGISQQSAVLLQCLTSPTKFLVNTQHVMLMIIYISFRQFLGESMLVKRSFGGGARAIMQKKKEIPCEH